MVILYYYRAEIVMYAHPHVRTRFSFNHQKIDWSLGIRQKTLIAEVNGKPKMKTKCTIITDPSEKVKVLTKMILNYFDFDRTNMDATNYSNVIFREPEDASTFRWIIMECRALIKKTEKDNVRKAFASLSEEDVLHIVSMGIHCCIPEMVEPASEIMENRRIPPMDISRLLPRVRTYVRRAADHRRSMCRQGDSDRRGHTLGSNPEDVKQLIRVLRGMHSKKLIRNSDEHHSFIQLLVPDASGRRKEENEQEKEDREFWAQVRRGYKPDPAYIATIDRKLTSETCIPNDVIHTIVGLLDGST